jgi:hypothetical protein
MSNVQIPNLPGNQTDRRSPKNRTTIMHTVNGVRIDKDHHLADVRQCLTGRGNESRNFETTTRSMALTSTGRSEPQQHLTPSFIVHDKEVLRFFAYFKETVHESHVEAQRVRYAIILFYLVDGQIEIQEPRQVNSGIPQGTFLKRNLLPKAGGEFYTDKDFSLCSNFTVFGRTFRIYDCDSFTKMYYEREGTPLPQAELPPQDGYAVERLDISARTGGDNEGVYGKHMHPLKSFQEAALGNFAARGDDGRSAAKAQFLANEGKVLRFECEYDERDKVMYGEMMCYVIHYFLCDGTAEVKEKRQANNGRDAFPMLLARQKIPRDWATFHEDEDRDRGVEENSSSSAYLVPEMLSIGTRVNIYGRDLKIVDCDDFTRRWYEENGVSQAEACYLIEPEAQKPEIAAPPYTGYGTPADSMGSVTHLVPKVPKKDFIKFMKNQENVLRFSAKLVTENKHDKGREFILAYFLSNDEIGIYERPKRNCGIVTGKFLERGKYRNTAGNEYTYKEIVIGQRMLFSSHTFEIVGADVFTKKWLKKDGGM